MSGSTPTTTSKMGTTEEGLEKENPTVDMKKVDEDADTSEKEEALSPVASYIKLWSFATPLDVFLRCLGALASAGGGTAEPLMSIIFGNLVNLFNGDPPISPEEFRSQVNKNALYFVYLFIGKFAVSRTSVYCG
jgi:ATP-binding cassette subfamily B (MDR/TAP) protein 1